MSPRAKQQLYHSLAQLIRAGITFPQALDKLSASSRGPARRAITKIRAGLKAGKTVAEACTDARPMISAMEASVLTAVERAGSLDRGLEQLANHYAAIGTARGQIAARLAYPIFLLIIGVLLFNLSVALKDGVPAYIRLSGGVLAAIVIIAWLLNMMRVAVANAATFSPAVDGFVRFLPMIGGMQRAFAMSRFCLVYDLQLEAGINTLDALTSSASASRSGLVRAAVKAILPDVRGGAQVGPLLAGFDAFDPTVTQAIIVGEESGRLDQQLRLMATEQERIAMSRLDTLAEWVPRMIYLGVLIYVGLTIVRTYSQYLNAALSIGE